MSTHPTTEAFTELADQAVTLARRWVAQADRESTDTASERLSGLLADPLGPGFAVGFIDGVVRPEDTRVSAHAWREVVAAGVPTFLPWYLRQAVKAGAVAANVAPSLVVPVAKKALRQMVAHLVLDADEGRLARGLARLHAEGIRPNVNLLGEAVLGSEQAAARLAGTQRLLERGDVDYVSIKVSAVTAPPSHWAFDEAVADVVEHLLPLYRAAQNRGDRDGGVQDGGMAIGTPQTFINLDMEEYRDLDLTLAVFTTILDRPEFLHLEAGVVLQAYLPDALGAMQHLQTWSAARRARGGAAIKVRVVKGANLPMERVESQLRGWELATWESKQATDAHYKRVLEWALRPEHAVNVRIGVAGHNLFDLAWTLLLARSRGIEDLLDVEMLLGMAPATAQVLRRETGRILLYTPVVASGEFDVAIAYLVRRLEEGAAPENFMSAMFELTSASAFAREEGRFRASLADLATRGDVVPGPRRTQNRLTERPRVPERFANTPDSDPALTANRVWGRAILGRVAESRVGSDLVAEHTITDADELDVLLGQARTAGRAWGQRPGAERAEVLRRAAAGMAAARGELLEVMASECGKTLAEGDPEVSEACDFASWYADLASELDNVEGATFHPRALSVVTPPWNFPVAIPAGSTLAALAAGSAVVLKPAPQAQRCGALLARVLWEAGVPREVLRLAILDETGLASRLITDRRVDQVILTGGYETAELFASMRPGLRLFAETSGKNAMVVTPAADLDLAAKDLVHSAFGHAGQKCSAASLGILVGSVATSERFLRQLVDATRSLVVAWPGEPRAEMGPLVEVPGDKLRRGLTVLAPGESWLVRPEQLDDSGQLWSPGIRIGVQPGSEFHRTEYFGPVLGLMAARDLEQALTWQNGVDYGLTAGLHSLDHAEQRLWLGRVQAGNLYLNRGTTGAIVRRQPFGGWKKSAVGPGTKAGGPHHLVALGNWAPDESGPHDEAWLARAAANDRAVWADWSRPIDVSDLGVETNVLRHLPVPVTVRAEAGADEVELRRVLAAGQLVGADVSVSVDPQMPVGAELSRLLKAATVETQPEWVRRLQRERPARVRVLGESAGEHLDDDVATRPGTRKAADISTAVWDQPVTGAGRVELLPFLHEQAVSATHHRFGTLLGTPLL